jgi:hypothetical protein
LAVHAAALRLVVRPTQHRDAVRLPAGDLDPHASVPGHDGDHDRLPRHGRAAVEQTVGHYLAGQENRDVTARVRRAKHAAHERADNPRRSPSPGDPHALPNYCPSHQRTCFPVRTETPQERADAQK